MVEEGSTTGVWVGEGESELFDDFDAYFERHGRPEKRGREVYSRSARIKEAMDIAIVVHDTVRKDPDLPHPDELTLREYSALVRSEIKFDDR